MLQWTGITGSILMMRTPRRKTPARVGFLVFKNLDFNFGPQEGDSDEEEGQEALDDLEGEEDVAQTQQSEGQVKTEGLQWEEVPMDAPDMK
jgi:hypothetical protein